MVLGFSFMRKNLQNRDEGSFTTYGIQFLEDGLSLLNDSLNDFLRAFYFVDQFLRSLGSNFFPYSLQQFLSFSNGSLNNFFASR